MTFINEIAHILHSNVDACCGFSNKNLGDSFLMIWKLDEKYISTVNSVLTINRCNVTENICLLPILAFSKCAVSVA
jgi:hypothetical protein